MQLHAVVFICPFCDYDVTDSGDAQYGWCRRCRDCTAMCAAGRRIVLLDPANPPARRLYLVPGRNGRPRASARPPRWDLPCLTRATAIWDLTCDGAYPAPDVLCAAHGDQLRGGLVPGIAGTRKGPMPGMLPALASWNDWL
jgi:hypothetical protein